MAEAAAVPVHGAAGPLLAVDGLVKHLGGRRAVAGLTLALQRGEVLGLVGANGGGKTTALRMLAGLLAPDAGSGEVLGCRLPRDAARIRRHVGYMAQRLALYGELTVLENLRFRAEVYGLARPRAVAEAAIARHGLGAYAHARADTLSGGWARRLQLAAALVHQPALLLLDEPTAGLDAASRQEVWARLGRLARAGAGVVVCTHDLAEAERCARLLYLARGRVLAEGTPEQVARGAGADAYVLRAPVAARTEDVVDGLPGVLARQAQGDALRVVVARGAGEGLRRAARALAGATLEPAALRLEDAALVYASRAGDA